MSTPDTVVVTVVAAEPVAAREDASGAAAALGDEAPGVERCRICFEGPEEALPLVSLTCLCKGGLSQVHTPCAEAWFKRKGVRGRHTRWGLRQAQSRASQCLWSCGCGLTRLRRHSGNGTCELCNAPAYVLSPAVLAEIKEREALRHAQRRRLGLAVDPYPRVRKVVVLVSLAVTLGLVLSAVLGWVSPTLWRTKACLAIGFPTFALLFVAFHRRIHARIPRTVTASWHAVGMLLLAFAIVDGSLMLQIL